MKRLKLHLLLSFLIANGANAQKISLESKRLIASQVTMSLEKFQGKDVVRVVKDASVKEVDEATFVRIKDLDFKDGAIKVKVLSRLTKDASPTARGFIGVAFRINEDNTKFECIYIRPANGRSDDQVRRNHSIQYFSYPDFKFDKLRKISPEAYESYADMGLDEWIDIRIIVNDKQARLYLNDNRQPSLVIKDLKLGENATGALGLFVDVGTEGYFTDLSVTKL